MIAILFALALAGEPPAAPEAAPERLIQVPKWVAKPDGGELAELYPRKARDRGLSGRATIVCRINANGSLRDCVVKEETPADAGFGEATVRAARFFRMEKTTPDGEAVEGGVVILPLVWSHPNQRRH